MIFERNVVGIEWEVLKTNLDPVGLIESSLYNLHVLNINWNKCHCVL